MLLFKIPNLFWKRHPTPKYLVSLKTCILDLWCVELIRSTICWPESSRGVSLPSCNEVKFYYCSKSPTFFEIDIQPQNICTRVLLATNNLFLHVPFQTDKSCQIIIKYFPKIWVSCKFIFFIVTLNYFTESFCKINTWNTSKSIYFNFCLETWGFMWVKPNL